MSGIIISPNEDFKKIPINLPIVLPITLLFMSSTLSSVSQTISFGYTTRKTYVPVIDFPN